VVRLGKLVDDLIELEPETVGRPERHSIWLALYSLIQATHLHTVDPTVALERRFAGDLERKKIGVHAFTSLALFTDDVERLLRDLYGDIPEVDPVVRAVSVIAQELLRFAQPDLWQEHQDAVAWDYIHGIGLPEGYGISGSEHGRGIQGANNLRIRARRVIAEPSSFSKYTVEFTTKHIVASIRMENPSISEEMLAGSNDY
jgi:hypothetical protein